MPRGVPIDAPGNPFSEGTRPGGDMLTGEGGACRDNSFVSHGEVADQDIEVHQGTVQACRPQIAFCNGALERKPLAVWGWLQRDPAGIPLDWRSAQQPGPEPGQAPRIRTVQHDLPDPADRVVRYIAHQAITSLTRP